METTITKKRPSKVAVHEPQTLQLTNPDHIAAFAHKLEKFIKDANLTTLIQGRQYVNVDGWKFAGLTFGLTAIVKEPVRMDEGKVVVAFYEEYINQYQKKAERVFYCGTDDRVSNEIRLKKQPSREMTTELHCYKCECDIINLATGAKAGYGFATCSNAESKKISFDQYAVASMAQTRAIGKAYRNLLGFIMNAAGFESTPTEEMAEDKYHIVESGAADATAKASEDGIDIITQTTIDECKTLDELSFMFEKNQHLKDNKHFKAALTKRKLELKKI